MRGEDCRAKRSLNNWESGGEKGEMMLGGRNLEKIKEVRAGYLASCSAPRWKTMARNG